MKKKKKIKLFIVFGLIFILVCYLVLSFFLGSSNRLFLQGSGDNYAFAEVSELCNRIYYEYDSEQDSIWDYYSVDYEITTFEVQYYERKEIEEYLEFGKWRERIKNIEYEFLDINEVDVKGSFARDGNIYYLREDLFGVAVEELFDLGNNYYAFQLSGGLIYKWLYEMWAEESFNSGWQCEDSLSSEEIEESLLILKHFYDKEILELFQDENLYNKNGDIYTIKQSEELLDSQIAKNWFLSIMPEGLKPKVEIELTNVSASIDLSSRKNPKVNFKIKAFFPKINKAVSCGGNLTYNYVNNTVICIPSEVRNSWNNFKKGY